MGIHGKEEATFSARPRRKTAVIRRLLGGAAILLTASLSHSIVAADWQASLGPNTPGPFPPPSPQTAKYRIGWSGLTAATGEVRIGRSGNRIQASGKGRTIGLARVLYRTDATQEAVADRRTLRPIQMKQVEVERSKRITTECNFEPNAVISVVTDRYPDREYTKRRQFKFSGLHDMHTALLHVRSQSLADRTVVRFVVYPGSSAYLATVTVVGREKIRVQAGSFDAIKLDLQLKKIGKNRELKPHSKFRRATVWFSDDANRLLLRADAQIFVGTVFAELQSVRYDGGR